MRVAQIAIKGISEQKKLDIIRAVLTSDGISRNEIAEKCGISSMTVGKVISEMMNEGLICSESISLGKGRRTELFRAAQTVSILVFCFEARKLSVVISDVRGDISFSHSQLINDSLPYESNVADLVTSVYEPICSALRETVCCVSVITEDGIHPRDLSVINSIIPEFYIDVLADKREYISDHIRENYPEQTVMLVSIGDKVELSLYYRGADVSSRGASKMPREHLSVEEIADILATLSHIVIPDTVIVEADRALCAPDLLPSLKNELCRKLRIPERDMPEFILVGKTPVATLSAIKRATDKLIGSLAGVAK